MSNKSIDVVNIGNVIMDIIIKVSDEELKKLGVEKGIMHLVDENRQRKILDILMGKEKEFEMGGSGPNMLRTLAILGGKCALAGLVAKDIYGTEYVNRMEKLSIINKVRMSENGITGTSIILVTEDGQRTMNTNLGNSRYYTVSDVPTEEIKQAKYLFVTGYQWDTKAQIDSMEAALKIAKENGTQIAFDLADPFAVGRSKEAFEKVINEYANVVFANEEEAKMMYQDYAEKCVEKIAQNVDIAVVKVGSRGSLVKEKGKEMIQIKPTTENINVIDTTAAGDMYAGGFMYGLVNGYDVERCARIGSRCAEEVIQNIGAKLPEDINLIISGI